MVLILVLISSCKNENKRKIVPIPNGLTQSYSIKKINNNISDFIFEIDTSKKITTDYINGYFKNIDFYKLNISHYDSIYIGKRNDTIFTLDQDLGDFVEIFLILNKDYTSYRGRLGDDYAIHLLSSNDSIFNFDIIELEDRYSHDIVYFAPKYPERTVSEIKTDYNGKLLEIKINDKTERK